MDIEARPPTINPSFKLATEIPRLASNAINAVIQQQGNINYPFNYDWFSIYFSGSLKNLSLHPPQQK